MIYAFTSYDQCLCPVPEQILKIKDGTAEMHLEVRLRVAGLSIPQSPALTVMKRSFVLC